MTSTETVKDFIQRAVDTNNVIRIEADDMLPITGIKEEVIDNKITALKFGGFKFVNNVIVIQALFQ